MVTFQTLVLAVNRIHDVTEFDLFSKGKSHLSKKDYFCVEIAHPVRGLKRLCCDLKP